MEANRNIPEATQDPNINGSKSPQSHTELPTNSTRLWPLKRNSHGQRYNKQPSRVEHDIGPREQSMLWEAICKALERSGLRPVILKSTSAGVSGGSASAEFSTPLAKRSGRTAQRERLRASWNDVSNQMASLLDWHSPLSTINNVHSPTPDAVHQVIATNHPAGCTVHIARASPTTILRIPLDPGVRRLLLIEPSRDSGAGVDAGAPGAGAEVPSWMTRNADLPAGSLAASQNDSRMASLLGTEILDLVPEGERRWRNVLRREEIEWLDSHKIASRAGFPASGYLSMVLEAVQALAGGRPIQAVEVHDFHVARSMFFEESGTETLFKLDIFQDDTETGVSAAFSCHANFESKLRRHAHGNVEIVFGDRNPSLLPERQPEIRGLVPIDADDFYSSLDDLGYGYSGLFRGITMLARKQDTASGRMLSSPCSGVTNRRLVPHPATMETLIQSILAAVGALRDGRLFALCVPTRIERIVFNPLVGERDGLGEIMTFEASTTMYAQGCIKGDVAMFDLGGKCAIQMEGVTIRPLEDPTPADDRLLFFELVWCPLGTESVVVDRPQFLELSSGRELVPNVGVQMDRSGGSSTGARRTSRRRLYIIRGTNPESSILARELETALSPFFEDVTVAQAFENLELQGSRLMLTTVSLIDMDGLYFGDLANTQSESLKRLLNSSRDCIWATSGEGIYHDSSFVRGLLESVALQNPRFRYQHLEIVENEEIEVKVLAAHLSRMVLSSLTDSNASESRPWTVEPALRLQDGKLWAPRISPSHQMNMRYMSDRRQIEEEIDCQALGVVVSDDGGLTKAARQRARMEKMVEVQAKYAISLPLRFERVGLLFLVLGTSLETSSSVIALARRRESIFTTRASWSWPVPSNIKGGRSEAAYLYSTASFLFAANIVSLMSHGETALIHEADDVLKFATITCATAAGIRVVFTQAGSGDIGGHSGRGENGDVITIALDRMSSKAAFAKAVPIETISIAANFGANSSAPAVSSAGDVWSRLVSVLRPTARRERLNSLRQSPSSAFSILCRNSRSSNRPGAVSLERARTQAALVCAKRELPAGMLIDVQSWAQQTDGFKIIDWAGSQRLRVQVQPASSLVRVSPGRTYLLGGMTDHLGRSISQWMISRGARNIILASRHPKIEDWWIEEMAMLGGRVSAMAMDLTEPKSVRKFERALRKDLSLLGGVVISADQSFSATALEDWPHAARRTVEGSKLMDSLFDGKSLDFFVMMLPLTETRGDSVRPVAVALSSFASTVVARRRERNLVGSILYHPGQSPSEDANFYRLSEQDLHEAVAEAILAGRPDSGCSPEIFAGLNKCVS